MTTGRYYQHATTTRDRYCAARHNARYAHRRWYQTLRDGYATTADRERAYLVMREMHALVPGGMRRGQQTVELDGWRNRRARYVAGKLLRERETMMGGALALLDSWNRRNAYTNTTRH